MNVPESPNSGNIVVGVDSSPTGEHAVLWAAEQAHLQHCGLTLVHAMKPVSGQEQALLTTAGITQKTITDQTYAHADRTLDRARSLASDRFPEVGIETMLHVGDPRTILLELSETSGMLVVGSRGLGRVAGLLLGSVSGALVRHAACPVAVVRPTSEGRRGVLVGADGSEASLVPLERAFAQASSHGMPLTVLHCLFGAVLGLPHWWSHVNSADPGFEEGRLRMAESLAGMREKYPDVPVDVSIAKGAVDACLVDLSDQYDVLVIGRVPHSLGERLILPGLATSVAEHAHAPVLVVP